MGLNISVIVVTKNEERQIERCLHSLAAFDDVIVVDSGSRDRTKHLAAQCGAKVVDFKWDGKYPKKRQWCLDYLVLKHDFVFFMDADEVATPSLIEEMGARTLDAAGYFIKGTYILKGKALRFGLKNNKLCLIDRRKMMFPVIDDLDIPGMGEIEGHYQPVLKEGFETEKTESLKHGVLHYAYEDERAWAFRHEKYARWEMGMNEKEAWPEDPVPHRQKMKDFFRTMPYRPQAAFLHSYVLKAGFLDGKEGYHFARSRAKYYELLDHQRKTA